MHHYILRDGGPAPEPDLLKWARWFETADREVAYTVVEAGPGPSLRVSTVFLGMDHAFGVGPALLCEPMGRPSGGPGEDRP